MSKMRPAQKKSNHTASARQAVSLIKKAISNPRQNRADDLIDKLNNLKKAILSSKKDPITKNSLNYILYGINSVRIEQTKAELNKRISAVLEHLSSSADDIAELGSGKIKKGAVVYTHGHSSTVLNILLKAKKRGAAFQVHNTEAKPFLSGISMAEQLAKHNIPISQHTDLALRIALKNADIVMMGADIITEHGQVYGSVGSELIAEIAEKYDIPVYVCADSWKFSSNADEYEKDKSLVLPRASKKVSFIDYKFEKINPKLIAGIITEKGIFKPHYLISEIKKQHPWMLRK